MIKNKHINIKNELVMNPKIPNYFRHHQFLYAKTFEPVFLKPTV